MTDWEERAQSAQARFDDGVARLPEDRDERQRQLARMGNAAWAAGLSLLMFGQRDEANTWLDRAADTYRESWTNAPARKLGQADRRDEVAAHRRRSRGRARRCALGARRRCRGRRARSAAMPRRSRTSCSARTKGPRARRRYGSRGDPAAVAASLPALAARDATAYDAAIRRARRRLRGRDGVPRGHHGRRHRARASGARRGARDPHAARLACSRLRRGEMYLAR